MAAADKSGSRKADAPVDGNLRGVIEEVNFVRKTTKKQPESNSVAETLRDVRMRLVPLARTLDDPDAERAVTVAAVLVGIAEAIVLNADNVDAVRPFIQKAHNSWLGLDAPTEQQRVAKERALVVAFIEEAAKRDEPALKGALWALRSLQRAPVPAELTTIARQLIEAHRCGNRKQIGQTGAQLLHGLGIGGRWGLVAKAKRARKV